MGFFIEEDGYPRVGRIFITIIVAIVVLSVGGWGIKIATAHIRGQADAYQKTETGDYQIANYELFKNECNAIVAADAKITTAQQTLDSDSKAKLDSFQLHIDSQNLQAIRNQRIELITQYNADASKSKTKAKFKDAGLPSYINLNSQIGSITCPSS